MNIPLYSIFSDEEDVEAVASVIRRKSYWTGGKEVQEFEEVVADYLGRRHAVSFNSGTSALHASILALGIASGDEVIVPSFTFISTAMAPLFIGARPVFADIEPESYGLDVEDVARRTTSKTKAVIPIHYGGTPCRIRELREYADDSGLILIEDAAETIGAKTNGRKVGSFGDVTILSFTGNKLVTSGEGGMVATDDTETYRRLKAVCSHGVMDREAGSEYVGYNWRMSTLTAALGRSQFRKIDAVADMRRKNAGIYGKMLDEIDEVTAPQLNSVDYKTFQMYTVQVDAGEALRDDLKTHLDSIGVSCKVYFPPIHRDPIFRQYTEPSLELPNTERVSGMVLTLPMYPELGYEEIRYVCENIKEYLDSDHGKAAAEAVCVSMDYTQGN
ncbi:DegT/DnrJ/EryC1/StrS family aminotransferase [Candidatus Bathyarchaeota archaeon]|nr:DegT/DnrJ/EryC1/StrS family aminotransferase [Candidatus Bathyarchaeota archaeon]